MWVETVFKQIWNFVFDFLNRWNFRNSFHSSNIFKTKSDCKKSSKFPQKSKPQDEFEELDATKQGQVKDTESNLMNMGVAEDQRTRKLVIAALKKANWNSQNATNAMLDAAGFS